MMLDNPGSREHEEGSPTVCGTRQKSLVIKYRLNSSCFLEDWKVFAERNRQLLEK
ncbi:hypothetical protein KHA93_22845 [Bacillus sp. FJAT-49732]|uniref:Uncharacterized protein n=1 Tax=Lederbergia citrisecunda TaxID=2833583 RepID=A0A942YP67_9BACI|nr:hypothetical protein [Lederbergia citrisecunda]MBS4202445.1 hypothetical protein [Lederbergia citrisecunda]